MIVLEDLKGLTEEEIIKHLAVEYSGKEENSTPTKEEINESIELLSKHNILIAYESVGDWGCDSSAFFLLKNKENGQLYEIHGSHCSCYGFESQLHLEETIIESLKERASKNCVFSCGGYDENINENEKIINSFIKEM